ncbi:regulatory protein RecX [Thalassotalea aquiviva]|uniref:regulatory protein RecX n=1 Tax=Thalassotalea aquiviva TaxID=3242415 RepID=UPI00352B4671
MVNFQEPSLLNKDIKKAAYSLLARREHSRQELMHKLLRKEFTQEDITPVLEALDEQNIQSDFRFGECQLRQRVTKGYGWQYIRAELKQKGLSSDLIYQLEQQQDIDWFLQALKAYNKRFGDTVIADDKDRAKRIRFLQYRGFSTEQILAALETN